jgi:lysophospholipid acyltransferase (LPLAT)-like uncharacterized protein
MSKVKIVDPLDRKFTLESIRGSSEKGVRGKYFAKVNRGTNMVKLAPEIAKVFTNDEAVNEALASIIEIAKLTKLRPVPKRKSA